jgi:hypothetical protein
MITEKLELKLAEVLSHLVNVRSGHTQLDKAAVNSYLDDPEVVNWMDDLNKKGQIRNTRFTYVRPKP